MISEVSPNNRLKPCTLLGDGLMHSLSEFRFYLMKLGGQPLLHGGATNQKLSSRLTPQEWVKPRKLNVSGFRFPSKRLLSRRAKRPNRIKRVFSRVELQRESLKPIAQFFREASGIVLVLETHNEIIGPSNDDHVATRITSPPLLCPKIQADGRDES